MKLGNLCDIVRGSSPRPQGDPRYFGGPVPRLMIADLTRDGMYVTPKIDSLTEEGAKKSRPMKKGDVIIAVSGDPGQACILNVDACIHDGFVGLRNLDETKVYKPYLLYYLAFFKSATYKGAVGAIFKNLTTDQIKNINIPEIDRTEQIRIASTLSEAEALINQRKESIRLLDEFLSSTFFEMFGDPVKNEKKWKQENLSDLCIKIADIDHKMPKAVDEGYPFISAKDLSDNGTISFDDVKRISKEDFLQLSKKIKPQKGDIIYSRIGAKLGKARIVNVDCDFVVSYSCCTIRPNPDKINTVFLNRLLDSPYLLKQALRDVRAIGVPDLGMDKIRKFKIILPEIKLQDKFAEIVESADIVKVQYKSSLHELEHLYTSLSQRAFKTGLQFKSDSKVVAIHINEKEEDYFKKRKALACYIINQSLDDEKLGDTKFEKLLNLSDQYAIQRNLGQSYYQKVAGPYDNEFTKLFYIQIAAEKLYKRKRSGKQSVFIPDINHKKTFTAENYFSSDELSRVDNLITYFKKYTYEQPEIISTLYAIWNNRMIRQQQITDEVLKQDFLDWDEKKKKYKDRVDAALAWMKKENIVPNGWGKLIEKPKDKQRKLVVGKKRSSSKRAS